jgi:hypothetical protein
LKGVVCLIVTSEIKNDFILGSSLGDGSIKKSARSANYYMKFGHCENQYDYLIFKSKVLKDICMEDLKVRRSIDKRSKSTQPFYEFTTRSNPIFHKFKEMSHLDHIRELNINSLLIWYLDDGSIRPDRYGLRISCARFTMEEVIETCSIINEKFNTEFSIVNSKSKKHGHDGIGLKKDGTSYFLEIIKKSDFYNEIPECMRYKL